MTETPDATTDLLAFIEASPTPWHCVDECAQRLDAAGWTRVDESDETWPDEPGARLWTSRGDAALIAWQVGQRPPTQSGFRIVGAHTDSPGLRIKPRPDRHKAGCATLGVETYGGAIWATWTDRDLSIAGRVSLRDPDAPMGVRSLLMRVERPLCLIPNLAVHLNRGVNDDGLKLNKQTQLPPVWAMADKAEEGGFRAWLADELEVEADQILGWDLCLYDVQPPSVGGRDGEFIHAPRLDNQACCHAGLTALCAQDVTDSTAMIALFDHEEVGSRSSRGAQSSFLRDVLVRVAGSSGALARAAASSFVVSADMAHAIHPNYADKHDAEHAPKINGGPVLKIHSEWRYVTDAESCAVFRAICADAGVPLQEFVNRTDLRCGSTIGPIVAAELGMKGIDVGGAIWGMHSVRETGGSEDQPLMIKALSRFLRWG
jgi:aspartyl aminopeptidase